jgi:[NiFe] hydrogenase diaphorase moiety large subunit
MKRANLRGRGGAGFTTRAQMGGLPQRPPEGRAGSASSSAMPMKANRAPSRTVCCSPASPTWSFEGMTVAAYAVGATKGFVYLRGEYRYLLDHLNAVLAHRRRENLLGKDILGIPNADFDIEIHVGAGAYVCGEESALIESLEGKRGTPRNRPPFPVTNGYLDQPTIVNNVETFAAAALIALNGGDWYAGIGTKQSAGTKILSVSGDCAPGRAFTNTRSALASARCLRRLRRQPIRRPCRSAGRPAFVSAENEFDRIIGFEDIPTAGAFTIFDGRRDMFQVARNYVHFFQHESCGFCTPCRVGTSLAQAT